MNEYILTSPSQEGLSTREAVMRYSNTSPRILDLIESLTSMTMQAALEDPLGELEWGEQVWSLVAPEDLQGLDDDVVSRLQATVLAKSFWARKLLSMRLLVDENTRLLSESLTKG